jgi:hypothetical protein
MHWNASFFKNSMNAICLTRADNDEIVYIRKNFMRKTGMLHKENFNVKNNLHHVIREIFGIEGSFVEKAKDALKLRGIKT